MRKIAVRYDNSADRRRRQQLSGYFIDDNAWIVIQSFFPPPATTGRPREWTARELLEAIFHLLRSGCQWRLLPEKYPPYSTVQRYFYSWRNMGLMERINYFLVQRERQIMQREASPSAAVIDSQSVRTTTTGNIKGFDGGKKILGLKRHLLVDTQGNLLLAGVSHANLHDSVAGSKLVKVSRRFWPFISGIFADSAYRGKQMENALPHGKIHIVTGPTNQKGFVVQKRRWVVERTIAWININRRLVRDYERSADTAIVMIYLASILILLQRI